jgi:XTP/dITP diphosphohydrolase
MKLLIGTTNPAKLEEYKRLLADAGLDLVGVNDVNITEMPQEDGKSFEDNAVIKARFYADRSGLPALADDGGLEIEALNGEPGLHTPNLSDEDIIKNILDRMKDVPAEKRNCKLSVAIALSTPFGIMTSFSSMNGIIAETPSEKIIKGYPFRSIMYLPEYKKYHVDLTPAEEDASNHRRAALDSIKDMVTELSKYKQPGT